MADLLRCLVPEEDLQAHPHLKDTPHRATSWLLQYTADKGSLSTVLKGGFEELHDGLVVQRDIDFSALCAHHLLPFVGKAMVAYWPREKVVGLSKLARAVGWAAERVTLQEHITQRVAQGLFDELSPWFVAVRLYDVQHGCMTVRGVRQPHAVTDTFVTYRQQDSIFAVEAENKFLALYGGTR